MSDKPQKRRGPHPEIKMKHYLRGIPKSKTLITGPEDVIDRFNRFCSECNLSKWEAIELLMTISAERAREIENKRRNAG